MMKCVMRKTPSPVLNIGHNFANGMAKQILLEHIQPIHKEDFMFGTDNYLWIIKVDLNK